jgi:acyl carrier protein
VGEAGAAGVRLHLVAAYSAVRPLYGEAGVPLCEVEAGYVAEALRLAAPVQGIVLEAQPAPASLPALEASESVLQSYRLHGGAAQPAEFSLGVLERQSYRRYAARALGAEQWATLLGRLESTSALSWYAQIKAGGVEGMAPGYYRIDPRDGSCELLHADASEPERRYGGGSATTYAGCAVALYALGADSAQARLQAGAQGQRLSTVGVKAGVGVCAIGGFNEAGLHAQLGVDASVSVVHSWLLGAIDAEQTRHWEQEPAPPVIAPSERLRAALAQALPAYMVPSALVVLDRIPLTGNGKVDRKALPQPQEAVVHTRSYSAPRNELERTLAAIWQDVLGIEQVGLQDHFFEIGGDSLMLIRTRMRLNQALGQPIDIVDLFKYPTVQQLAAYLTEGDSRMADRRARTQMQAERQLEAARRARGRVRQEAGRD